MADYTQTLLQTQLFEGIGKGEIEGLLFFLNPVLRKYKKGNFIISAGGAVRDLGIVLEGRVQIIREDIGGLRSIIAEIEEGDMFAEALACAHVQRSPVSALSVTDSKVLFISFEKIMSSRSSLAHGDRLIKNLMLLIARKNIFLNSKLEHIGKRSIREKLLSYFSDLAIKAGGTQFEIPFSKTALADYLFIDRSAMSRELALMKKEKLLAFSGLKFKLKSRR